MSTELILPVCVFLMVWLLMIHRFLSWFPTVDFTSVCFLDGLVVNDSQVLELVS